MKPEPNGSLVKVRVDENRRRLVIHQQLHLPANVPEMSSALTRITQPLTRVWPQKGTNNKSPDWLYRTANKYTTIHCGWNSVNSVSFKLFLFPIINKKSRTSACYLDVSLSLSCHLAVSGFHVTVFLFYLVWDRAWLHLYARIRLKLITETIIHHCGRCGSNESMISFTLFNCFFFLQFIKQYQKIPQVRHIRQYKVPISHASAIKTVEGLSEKKTVPGVLFHVFEMVHTGLHVLYHLYLLYLNCTF